MADFWSFQLTNGLGNRIGNYKDIWKKDNKVFRAAAKKVIFLVMVEYDDIV